MTARLSSMIELVQQRWGNDCVVAALAMALGRSYEDVFAAVRSRVIWSPGDGPGVPVLEAVEACGVRAGIAQGWPEETVPTSPSLIVVASQITDGGRHAVVFADGKIYDPAKHDKLCDLAHAQRTTSWRYFGFWS